MLSNVVQFPSHNKPIIPRERVVSVGDLLADLYAHDDAQAYWNYAVAYTTERIRIEAQEGGQFNDN